MTSNDFQKHDLSQINTFREFLINQIYEVINIYIKESFE